MRESLKQRIEEEADYILSHSCTVRAAADALGVAKSTLHIDVTKRLKQINPPLFAEVERLMDSNFSHKHIRGGEATKNKYKRKFN